MDKTFFTEREKLFLVQLVAGEKDIIENKRTDGTNAKLKNEAWETITSQFNSQGFSQRSAKQLRKCWENIKQRKRKLNTVARQEQLRTGGGSPIHIPENPVMDFVDAAAPNVDVELNCSWDITAIFENKTRINSAEQQTTNTPTAEPIGSSATTPDRAGLKRKAIRSRGLEAEELALRKRKIEESIDQQRELHQERLKTTRIEQALAVLKLRQQLNEMGLRLEINDDSFENFNINNFSN